MIRRHFTCRRAAWLALTTLLAVGPAAGADQVVLPVPVVTLYPGDVIGAGQIERRAFPAASTEAGAVEHDAARIVGRAARRTLLPGRPIPLAAIGDAHVVRAGALVTIVFRQGAFSMQTTGQALSPAAPGAPLKVRNADTGRVIDAIAQADGTVRVGE